MPSKLMNRDFVLLWQGQTVSVLGNQATLIAIVFWLKHQTGSASLLGLVGMISGIVAILLGPFGGTVADRCSRRKILIVADAVSGLAVGALGLIILAFPTAPTAVIVAVVCVSAATSAAGAFFMPALSAAIPDLAPKCQISRANSLMQSSVQLSILAGQAAGGTLFRLFGAPLLLLFDALTFFISAASESFIRIPQRVVEHSGGWRKNLAEFTADLVQGVRYIWTNKGLRAVVFGSTALNFFAVPVVLLLPFYVEDHLRVTTDWYGFLIASYGLGSLGGYLLAGAIRVSKSVRCWILIGATVLEGAGHGLLGWVYTPAAALGLVLAGGITAGFVTVGISSVLQLATPSEIRGRVFGLLATIAGSATPLAMGLSGLVADLLGRNIPLIFGSAGAIMASIAVMLAFNRDYRGFLATGVPDQPAVQTEELPVRTA